jgi:hypothetical protein
MIKSLVCSLVVLGSAYAQVPPPSPVSHTAQVNNLVALERMWNQAQLTRDSAAVAGLISDKFINTEYDGEVSNRGKFLADFADPKFRPSLMNIENVDVAIYAEAAIVTGDYHVKGLYAGKSYEHFGRFTDTWVLQEGKWLCVASHTSLVKK